MMKVVVDMNLSPEWLGSLQRHGIKSVHWSDVGPPRAADAGLLDWARKNSSVLLTGSFELVSVKIQTKFTRLPKNP